jgi:hypothetical protein
MEKKFQLSSTQFGTRLNPDEVNFINENILDLLPDDCNPADFTNRQWLMFLVEKTMSKVKAGRQSNPEDLQKIAKLEAEKNNLFELQDQNRIIIEKQQTEIEALKEQANQVEAYSNIIDSLKTEIESRENVISQIKSTRENEIFLQVTPLETAMINLVRERMEKRSKTPVTAKDAIFSPFWIYHTSQEWEYSKLPFVVSKKELKELIKQIPANNE